MQNLILLILLAMTPQINPKVNIINPSQQQTDKNEYHFDDEFEEFVFSDENLVVCSFCDNFALFIMIDDNELWGMCSKCYLNEPMPSIYIEGN
jgi:hypothetical protein